MLMMDPPEHTPMRKIANQGFTYKAIERWAKPIEKIFNGLLDSVCQKTDFDFASDIAGRFPTEVICELFAIPEADRQALRVFSVKPYRKDVKMPHSRRMKVVGLINYI